MKKRILALLLAAVVLSGCSLAQGTAEGLPENDQLVGMLVALKCDGWELWDEEATGMDPLHTYQSEGKKLYAEKIDGDPVGYQFPEGCGLSCFTFLVPETEPEESYWADTVSPELSDVFKGLHMGEGASMEMEATVYVRDDLEFGELTLYMNPVYYTPAGEVYALGTAPTGICADGLGGSFSVTQETKIELAENVTTRGGTVKLNIQPVHLPQTYVILEMSESNEVLAQTEHAPEEMPETYVPSAETAYIILEARGERVTRTVYSPADDSAQMDCYCPGQYGLCIKGCTTIEWEGVE